MKKILAMMLTAAMMLSMGTAAMAANGDDDNTTWTSEEVTANVTLNKIYVVTGEKDETGTDVTTATLYPNETLKFTSTPAQTNPDTTNITVNDLEVKGNTNQTITIKLPKYTKVGVYEYSITENRGEKQAVTYETDAINVKVLVSYDYEAKKLVTEIVPTTGANGSDLDTNNDGKIDTFSNNYDLGHLSVQKTTSGNLADDTVHFEMKVTFKSEKAVASVITVKGCDHKTNPTSIEISDWKAAATGFTAEKTIYLKADETIYFYNIPDGVTYTVEEDAKHGLGEDNSFDPNSAADTDYTVTYTNENGEIETAGTKAVVVNNEKKTNVETGISVDSIPYIAMLGVVAVGGAGVVVSKKRRSED